MNLTEPLKYVFRVTIGLDDHDVGGNGFGDVSHNGHMDVGDEFWRPDVLVTSLRC